MMEFDTPPALTGLLARELPGMVWRVDGVGYRFDGDSLYSGRESVTCLLRDERGEPAAYFKSFAGLAHVPKRFERTRWLIAQELHSWSPELRGAPRRWVDTRAAGRPLGFASDFLCYLADPVPGHTWAAVKEKIAAGEVELDEGFRWRCVQGLLRALLSLERGGIVHGDLSPNNLMVDPQAKSGAPAAHLIDFDAFVAAAAGALATLSTEEGGVYGTDGYCPPDLSAAPQGVGAERAPYSDRYGRDMLVLELFGYDRGCAHDLPPAAWPRAVLTDRLQRSGMAQAVPYLSRPDLFELPEAERPSSAELARGFGMSVPPPVKRRARRPVSVPGFCMREAARDTLFQAAVILLWFLCAAHWAILSYKASGWLVPVPQAELSAAGLMSFGVRLIVADSLLLGGVYGLSCLAFAEHRPRIVVIARLRLKIPGRRGTGQSMLSGRAGTVLRLAGILVALGAVVGLLVRFG